MRTPSLARTAVLTLLLGAAALVAAAGSHGDDGRFTTSRASDVTLRLPDEDERFTFAVFGDRTGGPPEGLDVLARAVDEVNLLAPELVMTVGDLVQGYNETPLWLEQASEYRAVMGHLVAPWFPVAGNHDIYWRGEGAPPPGEHEADYERHVGPLWYAFRHRDAWFVALYSDEGDPATGERSFSKPACQRISDEQLAWLEGTLARARDARSVFLFLHHPRWIGGGYGDDWERVHRVLAAAGNVRAVFAGHIHQMRYEGARDGIEYFALATTGGAQPGDLPAAGYLHHYLLVTVRRDGLDVAAIPVGGAFDPRLVTPEVSRLARRAADGLAPEVVAAPAMAADGTVGGELRLALRNPVERPLRLELGLDVADASWTAAPDHVHLVLGAGESREVALRLARRAPGGAWDAPAVAVSGEVLFERLSVPLPDRSVTVSLTAGSLPAPPRPEREGVLHLAGGGACARVPSDALDLADGPFTLEAWLRAERFDERVGLVCKTEGSELGLFAGGGRPRLLVHLAGEYVEAAAPGAMLETARWHHVAGVFDGAELRLYVDGMLVATSPGRGSRTPNALPLLIGADVDAAGAATSPFVGELDEVRVTAGAVYSGERFAPARRLAAGPETRLLLHADRQLGPFARDASAAGAHALLSGGARVAPE